MTRRQRVFLGGALAAAWLLAGQVTAAPVPIHWWHAMRGTEAETLKVMVARFNASQDRYAVIATYKGRAEETVNAAIAAAVQHQHPHLLQGFDAGTQSLLQTGGVYPVHQLMKDCGRDIDWRDLLQPALDCFADADGHPVALPFDLSTAVMVHNVDGFNRAGLQPLSRDKPVTWDRLGTLLEKIVAAGMPVGMVAGWPSWTLVENYSAIHNLPFATGANGYKGLDSRLSINNAAVVHHIARLKGWSADRRFAGADKTDPAPRADFAAGKAAVWVDSTRNAALLAREAPAFTWDVAPLPVESWMSEPQNSIVEGTAVWVLKGHSRDSYAGVAAFLAYLVSPEMPVLWHRRTGGLPITGSACRRLAADGDFDKAPYLQVGIRQMTRREPTRSSRGIRLGYFSRIRAIISGEIERVCSGARTPQQGLAEAVRRGNAQLQLFEKLRNTIHQIREVPP
jgi:sn-glycerol 3-phosphate transport system substrate-binding protein